MSMTKGQLRQQLMNDPSPDSTPIFAHDGTNAWEVNELTHQGVGQTGAGRKGGEVGSSAAAPQIYLRVNRTSDIGSQVGPASEKAASGTPR